MNLQFFASHLYGELYHRRPTLVLHPPHSLSGAGPDITGPGHPPPAPPAAA